jgi:hypothetical protein
MKLYHDRRNFDLINSRYYKDSVEQEMTRRDKEAIA